MNEKLSITLPAEMVAEINLQVEAGRYASPSDVLQHAMQAWMRTENEHKERLEEIRASIARSIADPRPPLTEAEVDARLDALMARYDQH